MRHQMEWFAIKTENIARKREVNSICGTDRKFIWNIILVPKWNRILRWYGLVWPHILNIFRILNKNVGEEGTPPCSTFLSPLHVWDMFGAAIQHTFRWQWKSIIIRPSIRTQEKYAHRTIQHIGVDNLKFDRNGRTEKYIYIYFISIYTHKCHPDRYCDW